MDKTYALPGGAGTCRLGAGAGGAGGAAGGGAGAGGAVRPGGGGGGADGLDGLDGLDGALLADGMGGGLAKLPVAASTPSAVIEIVQNPY